MLRTFFIGFALCLSLVSMWFAGQAHIRLNKLISKRKPGFSKVIPPMENTKEIRSYNFSRGK